MLSEIASSRQTALSFLLLIFFLTYMMRDLIDDLSERIIYSFNAPVQNVIVRIIMWLTLYLLVFALFNLIDWLS